jgi:glyoxylate/hydroxypyruvate reductase
MGRPLDPTILLMSGAQKRKIVVTRDIGQKALSLLGELDKNEWEIILWEEDRAAPRSWLEANVPGAEGLLVLLTDKVKHSFHGTVL